MPARDPAIARLTDHIQSARARGAALAIYGGGTKSFYGEPPRGEALPLLAKRERTQYSLL